MRICPRTCSGIHIIRCYKGLGIVLGGIERSIVITLTHIQCHCDDLPKDTKKVTESHYDANQLESLGSIFEDHQSIQERAIFAS